MMTIRVEHSLEGLEKFLLADNAVAIVIDGSNSFNGLLLSNGDIDAE